MVLDSSFSFRTGDTGYLTNRELFLCFIAQNRYLDRICFGKIWPRHPVNSQIDKLINIVNC